MERFAVADGGRTGEGTQRESNPHGLTRRAHQHQKKRDTSKPAGLNTYTFLKISLIDCVCGHKYFGVFRVDVFLAVAWSCLLTWTEGTQERHLAGIEPPRVDEEVPPARRRLFLRFAAVCCAALLLLALLRQLQRKLCLACRASFSKHWEGVCLRKHCSVPPCCTNSATCT